MDEKASERIKDFLDFLREAKEGCGIAYALVGDADKETQDILHWMEFNSERADERTLAKMVRTLGAVRRGRRKAKDAVETLKPAADWAVDNETVRKGLERLLGEARKAEKNTENRYYLDKTDVIARTLGEGGKEGAEK